ncbi:type II toxin-antitoxin system RelE/ParE family toxin [Kitasatospora sp. NPDC051984]|uniref:type II toxin-antitoxin system RelE/ParE family toxin n=1 Tax=Kitasatospora sp. NPDC051984 TaxID=3364059 RepID=UPI0037C6351C
MPTLSYTPAAARTLARLERGHRADPCRLRRIRRALDHLAADPHHPGLHSHRYAVLPGHEHTAAWTSYVDQGAGCWRLFWTYEHPDGDDQAQVTVLQIGPHR